jgi:hypothetical protein
MKSTCIAPSEKCCDENREKLRDRVFINSITSIHLKLDKQKSGRNTP